MIDPYTPIINQLHDEHGLRLYFQGGKERHQLVVSRQSGPAYPNAGNSCWICFLDAVKNWYICTWGSRRYRVADVDSLAELVEAFIDRSSSALPAIPDDLIERYGLVEIGYDVFEQLRDRGQT